MAEKTFQQWLDDYHNGIADAIRQVDGLEDTEANKILPESFRERILMFKNKPGSGTTITGVTIDENSVNVNVSELSRSYLEVSNLWGSQNKFLVLDNTNRDSKIGYAGTNATIDFEGAAGRIDLNNTNGLVFYGGELDESVIADGVTVLGRTGNYKGTGSTVVESIPGVIVGPTSVDIYFNDTLEGVVNANINNATSESTIRINGTGYNLTSDIEGGTVEINGRTTTYNINDSGIYSIINIDANSPEIDLKSVDGTVTIKEIDASLINSNKYIIENLSPENIANNVWILGKQGTFKGTSFVDEYKEVASITHLPYVIEPTPVQGGAIPNVLKSVTIRGVSPSIDPNIDSDNIKDGISILGIKGTYKGEAKIYADGTAIDPTQMIEEVYFNDKISKKEFCEILDNIELLQNQYYWVAINENGSQYIKVEKNYSDETNSRKGYRISIKDNDADIQVFEYYYWLDDAGNVVYDTGAGLSVNKYAFKTPLYGKYDLINIGYKNNEIYNAISKTDFTIPNVLKTKEITPSESSQRWLAPSGEVWNEILVEPITASKIFYYYDGVGQVGLEPELIKRGYTVLGITGTCDDIAGVTFEQSVLDINNTTTGARQININGQITDAEININSSNSQLNLNSETTINITNTSLTKLKNDSTLSRTIDAIDAKGMIAFKLDDSTTIVASFNSSGELTSLTKNGTSIL